MVPTEPTVTNTEKKSSKRKRSAEATVVVKAQRKEALEKECALTHKKAKKLCKTPEEWLELAKKPLKKIEDFVTVKEFERDQRLYSMVETFVQSGVALFCDRLTRSEGFVESEIKSDATLRDAIAEETSFLLGFLNNKLKIGMCVAKGVMEGKKEQQKSNASEENNWQKQQEGVSTKPDKATDYQEEDP